MSKNEYERLILEKHKDKLQFDTQICKGATLKDINKERVKWFLKEGKRQGRLSMSIDTPVREVLMRLKLLKNSGLKNSAILLFGKNVEQFFLQSETKCILLSTSKFTKPYESYQTYSGNLFEQVEKVTIFILENIKKSLWLESGKIAASSSHEIPQEAIREAVVNAIIHRDYLSPSKVQVRIFPDRIEIWNPGRLPSQLRIEDLKKSHPSIPYNPIIFRQFYRVGFVEDVGGGTTDIVEWCKKAGLLEPEFEQEMGFFIIKIKRSILNNAVLEKFGLNESQIKSIKHIGKYGRITRAEYEKLLLVSPRTASRELQELCKKGLIEKKGKGPAVYYILARYGEIWRGKKGKEKIG
jgi:ATP-dependent DNA helicase RecG